MENPRENDEKAQEEVTDSPSGLHYKAGDEPEPMDLTHLNIEAAMMCLAGRVRLLCGEAGSPSLKNRTFRSGQPMKVFLLAFYTIVIQFLERATFWYCPL